MGFVCKWFRGLHGSGSQCWCGGVGDGGANPAVAPLLSQMTTGYTTTPFCFPPQRGDLSLFVQGLHRLRLFLTVMQSSRHKKEPLALSPAPKDFLLIALSGFGRGELSPVTCSPGTRLLPAECGRAHMKGENNSHSKTRNPAGARWVCEGGLIRMGKFRRIQCQGFKTLFIAYPVQEVYPKELVMLLWVQPA